MVYDSVGAVLLTAQLFGVAIAVHTPLVRRAAHSSWQQRQHDITRSPQATEGTIMLTANKDYCLNLPFMNVANGVAIDLHACNGNDAQKWTVDNGNIKLAANKAYCLNLPSMNVANGASIDLHKCNGHASQKWTVDDGNIKLSTNKAYCLNLPGMNVANGASIDLHKCNGEDSQKWTPPQEAGNYYRKEAGVGSFGGECICPDGNAYEVGDNSDLCETLACEGGIAGKCHKTINQGWKGMKVTCAEAPTENVFVKLKTGHCPEDRLVSQDKCLVAAKLVGASVMKTQLDGGTELGLSGRPRGCTLDKNGMVEWWGPSDNAECGTGDYECVCWGKAHEPLDEQGHAGGVLVKAHASVTSQIKSNQMAANAKQPEGGGGGGGGGGGRREEEGGGGEEAKAEGSKEEADEQEEPDALESQNATKKLGIPGPPGPRGPAGPKGLLRIVTAKEAKLLSSWSLYGAFFLNVSLSAAIYLYVRKEVLAIKVLCEDKAEGVEQKKLEEHEQKRRVAVAKAAEMGDDAVLRNKVSDAPPEQPQATRPQMTEDAAATKIQARIRGNNARAQLPEEAAPQITSAAREASTPQPTGAAREKSTPQPTGAAREKSGPQMTEDAAATKIQARFRGNKARQKVAPALANKQQGVGAATELS